MADIYFRCPTCGGTHITMKGDPMAPFIVPNVMGPAYFALVFFHDHCRNGVQWDDLLAKDFIPCPTAPTVMLSLHAFLTSMLSAHVTELKTRYNTQLAALHGANPAPAQVASVDDSQDFADFAVGKALGDYRRGRAVDWVKVAQYHGAKRK